MLLRIISKNEENHSHWKMKFGNSKNYVWGPTSSWRPLDTIIWSSTRPRPYRLSRENEKKATSRFLWKTHRIHFAKRLTEIGFKDGHLVEKWSIHNSLRLPLQVPPQRQPRQERWGKSFSLSAESAFTFSWISSHFHLKLQLSSVRHIWFESWVLIWSKLMPELEFKVHFEDWWQVS